MTADATLTRGFTVCNASDGCMILHQYRTGTRVTVYEQIVYISLVTLSRWQALTVH